MQRIARVRQRQLRCLLLYTWDRVRDEAEYSLHSYRMSGLVRVFIWMP